MLEILIRGDDYDLDITELVKLAVCEAFDLESNMTELNKIEISLTLIGQFGHIVLNHYLPRRVFVEEATIKSITIRRSHGLTYEHSVSLIVYNSNIENITIKSNINSFVFDYDSNCKKLEIESETFNRKKIKHVSIKSNIDLVALSSLEIDFLFIDNFTFKKHSWNNNIEIELNSVKASKFICVSANFKNVKLSHGNYDEIRISSFGKSCEGISLENVNSKILVVSCIGDFVQEVTLQSISELQRLEITGTPERNSIGRLNFRHLSLSKDFKGEITSLNVEDSIYFNSITNQGSILLSFMNINLPISIFKSLMGNVNFSNCKIVPILKFHSSSIEEIRFFNTDEFVEVIDENDFVDLFPGNHVRDAYRQLKISSEKSSNKERAIFFRSKELDSYYKSLNFFKGHEVQEKITIGLNRLSNKHGMSWWRPLWLYLVLVAILYFCFLGSIGAFYMDNFTIYIVDGKFYRYLSDWYIPNYLHPTKNKLSPYLEYFHYPDFTALPLFSKAIIVLNDILLIPYLIYQFITAFRRHGIK